MPPKHKEREGGPKQQKKRKQRGGQKRPHLPKKKNFGKKKKKSPRPMGGEKSPPKTGRPVIYKTNRGKGRKREVKIATRGTTHFSLVFKKKKNFGEKKRGGQRKASKREKYAVVPLRKTSHNKLMGGKKEEATNKREFQGKRKF